MIKFNCNICAHDVQMILITNDEALMKNLFKSTLITINLFLFYYRYSTISQVYLGNLDVSLSFSHSKKKKELFPRQRLPQRRV